MTNLSAPALTDLSADGTTTRLAVVVGSTRPGRRGRAVADWVADVAAGHDAVVTGRTVVEVLDLADHPLPLLDEPVPAMFGSYAHEHTRRWSAAVDRFDAYVVVTPEYNHSLPAALKNAIDHLYAEWNGKVAGIVGYGVQGGTRAADHLRAVLTEVRTAVVPTQVGLSLFADVDYAGTDPGDPTATGRLSPREHQAEALRALLDEVVAWASALRPSAAPSRSA
ncbi:NADPH-dependent FMN reductase [Cellulomonas sp. NS3]|uniref:NADPH-dependent FMN reductase n=1 Tax=Cellulomonas sp. NS3 TaxID=2973977 RepID=UPI00216216CC|nr:NAD(P)H-dependent oxidoreductase [Cellulomonas sp. NS3]